MLKREVERQIECSCGRKIGNIIQIREDGQVKDRYFKSTDKSALQMKSDSVGLYIHCPACSIRVSIETVD